MKENLTLEEQTTLRLPEHELLLSFVNDSGKEKFIDWWYEEGEGVFNNYCEDRNDE